MFKAFNCIYKGYDVSQFKYNGRKSWLKVYLDILSNVPFQNAVKGQFDSSKFVSLPDETNFLNWLTSV